MSREQGACLPRSASRILGLSLTISVGLLASACTEKKVAQTPQAAPTPVAVIQPKPQFTATPGLSAKDRLKRSIMLLGNGEEGQARAELEAYLIESPNSDTGRILIEQIDRDPRDLLGYQSFNYTLKSGETLSVIADRYMGDRYKFWALAKYNNIAVPAGVSVGQSILIPGVARVIAAKPNTASRNDDDEINDRIEKEKKKAQASAAVKTTPAPTPAPVPAPVAVVINPENAKRYRKQGLEQLQRGNVDLAIAAFNRALGFAKGTSLYNMISSDLARAQKIKANMKK